ncbi:MULTISPECIES: O-methyltransferase [unclassified Vibrio]|uniref:O-methyltransferase n=1 Tax=unclassified Vibrio TaxID=2614977 RepID=UPI001361AA82|nr:MULTISPECIES: O-methyltransferase [unclassified Vibrio]NAW58121.1 methyltransferase domain-containing protein [Vibrio sp. V36_P2S2PM302]NAX26846.1 methyltransferase domain-containing protein [Vibrio sp. V38_P2S17PM301]NAX31830.1 methyltransferase domain-containing protein [Vibrio sp. V37_P2S8PM304]
MNLGNLLVELEQVGLQNDAPQSDRAKKYLNITRDTGEFLALLIKATQSNQVLEIGTSNGYSSLWLANALPANGQLFTIEFLSSKADEAQRHFERAGLSHKITQLRGDATELVNELSGAFDFIFLDANRATYCAMAERLFVLLKPGGLMVCDNAVSHQQELAEFVDWVTAQPHLQTSLVPVGKGELLIYKNQ